MEFEEVIIKGESFRIRKERSFRAASILEKKSRQNNWGIDDIIKVDCQIFNRKIKEWREITDLDLENLDQKDGMELFKAVMKLRKSEKDFSKTQPKSEKKPKNTSGK